MSSPASDAKGSNYRLVDYVFQVGLKQESSLLERILPTIITEYGSQADLSVISVDNTDGSKPKSTLADLISKGGHPIHYHYQAETIHRYPEEDYDESQKFPAYVPMFCFPNDLKLVHDDSRPPHDTYHSFVITEDMGTKCYGVCITLYEKPSAKILAQLEEFIGAWRSKNIQESDYEYAKHIQGQLAYYKEKLLKAKAGILEEGDDQKEVIATAEEKIILYEELLQPLKETLFVNVDHIYQPRCIGILSHWPWYDFMKDWLSCLVQGLRQQTITSLESAVLNLVHEIPLPPPGKIELGITISKRTLFCARPPVNTISHLRNFSLHPFFRTLSLPHIVILFESALMERKIIFMSSYTSMLAPACESLSQLLFPFYWHHILIPVLPSRLLSYLQAPVPYIVGVNRRYFGEAAQEEWMPSDAILVDLDQDIIRGPPPPVLLPHRERRKLLARLEKHVGPIGGTPSTTKHIPAHEAALLKGVPIYMKYTFPENYLLTHTHESYIGYRKVHDILKSTYSQYSNEFLHMKQPGRRGRSLLANTGSVSFEVIARSNANTPRVLGAPRGQRTSPIRAPPPINASSLTYGPSLGSVDMGSFASLPDQQQTQPQPTSPIRQVLSPLRNSLRRESEHAPVQPIIISHPSPISDDSNEDRFFDALTKKVNESFNSPISNETSIEISDFEHRPSFDIDRPIHQNDTSRQAQTDTISISSSTTTTKRAWWKGSKRESGEPTSSLQSPVNPLSFFSANSKNKRSTILGSFTSLSQTQIEEENKTGANYLNRFINTPGQHVAWSSTSLAQTADQSEEFDSSPQKDPERIFHREGHIFHELIPVVKADHVVDIGEIEGGSGSQTPKTLEDDDGVDQFGLDSQSSDDYTRSEASTILDHRSAVHRLPSPKTNLLAPSSSIDNKEGRKSVGCGGGVCQKKLDQFYICYFCREDLKREESTISMCELCHIKIHTDCLNLAEAYPCGVVFHEDKLRSSFLKVFTSLLKNYRAHLKTSAPALRYMGWSLKSPSVLKANLPTQQQDSEDNQDHSQDFFRREDFFAELDSETRAFMAQFIETQGFAQFVLDRIEKPESDYEVLFFDESIKAKLNRSKLRFTKETTPFLKEPSYAISTSIHTLPPLGDVPASSENKVDKSLFDWNPEHMFTPRQVQPLLTEQDYKMMRSHTNELIQRARVAMRQKQDLSKWMKTKMKQFQKMGNGELVALGTLPDEERKELLENRLLQVNRVIDQFEAIHISSQTSAQIAAALQVLHEQNLVLVKATGEEQLVDSDEQEEVQMVLGRLIRIITIYEDYEANLKNSNAHHLAERQESLEIQTTAYDRSASIEGIAPMDTKDPTPQPSDPELNADLQLDELVQAAEKRILENLSSSQKQITRGDRVAKWAADVPRITFMSEHNGSVPALPPPPVALENGKFMSSTFLKFDEMLSPTPTQDNMVTLETRTEKSPTVPAVGTSPSQAIVHDDHQKKESQLRP